MTVRVIKKNEDFIPQYRESKGKIWLEFSKGETIFKFDNRPDALEFIVKQLTIKTEIQ